VAPVELTGDRRAAVVLGASNVSRGLAHLAAAVRARSATGLDLFVAAGHGRGVTAVAGRSRSAHFAGAKPLSMVPKTSVT